jgi:hypothetical protein
LGTAGGVGTLYRWDSTANGGLGDWVIQAQDIGISISFRDLNSTGGKKSGTATADKFGVTINYSFAGSNNPNSALTDIKGGDVAVH